MADMPRPFYLLLVAALVGWGAYDIWPKFPVRTPAGVLAPADPVQEAFPARPLTSVRGYELTAVADYSLTARVLGTRRYRDRGGKLAPIDIAAGWGPMSDRGVLDHLRITQSFRFFFYEWKGTPPLPKEEIISHAANMHIIPATPEVAHAATRLHRGQVVSFSGQLVNVRGEEGFTWNTSLTRKDSGAGACELFYVESLVVEENPKALEGTVAVALPASG
jgi:hypothetical protein